MSSHFSPLFDSRLATSHAVTTLEMEETADLSQVTTFLLAIFQADPHTGDIALCVGGERLGVVGRARFEAITDTSHVAHRGVEIGAGDGATLPGAPTCFTLFRLTCGSCPQVVFRVAGDEPPPVCPEGHGPMADGA